SAVHAVVDAVDARRGGRDVLGVAEGGREHGGQGTAKPLYVASPVGGEGAVVGDASGDEGMGELEQDGSPPAGEQHDLSMEPPGHKEGGGLIRGGDGGAAERRHAAG